MTKLIKSNDGIKIGDIFYCTWGYEQTNISMFQVVKLCGKTSVVLREVKLEVEKQFGDSKNMYCQRTYKIPHKILSPVNEEYSFFYDVNNKEKQKQVQHFENGENFIKLDTYAYAYLYTGQKLDCTWYS